MVRLHSCTAGFLRFGSKAPTPGAVERGCGEAKSAAEGVVGGARILTGNPLEIRFKVPAGVAQPADVAIAPVPSVVVAQNSMKPGILPAIAVAWKLDSVSNSKE